MMIKTLGAVLLSLVMLTAASAQTLYGVTGAGGGPSSLYTIDTTTGTATLVGAIGFSHITGLSFDPTTGILYGHQSDLFGSNGTNLITINPVTGAGTLVGSTGIQVPDMSFRNDGTLFAWSESDNDSQVDDLFSINKVTATATFVGESNTGTSNTGLAFRPDGTLFLKPSNQLFTLDPITGAATNVGSITVDTGESLNNALAFDSNSQGYSLNRLDGSSFLYSVDVGALTATEIGDMGVGNMAALAFGVAVPEPATVALISGVALAGVAVGYRKLRKHRRFGKLAK